MLRFAPSVIALLVVIRTGLETFFYAQFPNSGLSHLLLSIVLLVSVPSPRTWAYTSYFFDGGFTPIGWVAGSAVLLLGTVTLNLLGIWLVRVTRSSR
jgi:hypothetical protein